MNTNKKDEVWIKREGTSSTADKYLFLSKVIIDR